MRRIVISLVSCILCLSFVDKVSAIGTHLDDNFQSYDNDSTLAVKWDMALTAGNNTFDPPAVTISRSLSLYGGVNSSQGMRMDFAFQAGVTTVDTGLGVNWEPCIYGITGFTTGLEDQTNLINYKGIRLWIKPGTITGNEAYFKLNIIESTITGGEKWMSPKVILSDLSQSGEYVDLDFEDFTEYYTGSGEPMDRSSINTLFLWLAYDGTATTNSSATIWIDDISAVRIPTQLDDDFESYADGSALAISWNDGPNLLGSGVVDMTVDLDTTGGANGSQAMEMSLNYNAGADDPGGIIGHATNLDGVTDLTDYTGINLWVKPVLLTGDAPYFTLHLLESSTNGEEKWIAKVPLSDLDTSGAYIYINFAAFSEYYTGSGEAIDVTNIERFYLGMAYDGIANDGGSATIIIDDISAMTVIDLPTHLDDDFEGYADSVALAQKWPLVYWGGDFMNNPTTVTMDRTLDINEGVDGSRAMRMDFTFQAGVMPIFDLGANWDPCIYGITGYYTNYDSRTDLSDYAGVRLWIKPGATTGNEAYFKLNLIESSTIGNEKWISPKIVLSELDPNGQYIYLDFDDFREYWSGSGETMDRSSIKISFLWLAYDDLSTANSSATIWIDDITYLKTPSLSVEQPISMIPQKFNLYQNYPNPFNPVTNIHFDISEISDVRIVIYDLLGREIIKLVDERVGVGSHTIQWDGRNEAGKMMASSVYIYRLETDAFAISRRMILLK